MLDRKLVTLRAAFTTGPVQCDERLTGPAALRRPVGIDEEAPLRTVYGG